VTDEDGQFEIERLNKFLQLSITVSERNYGEKKYYNIPWKRCTAQDFIKKGLKLSKYSRFEYEKRLCPDVTTEAEKIYKVMNSYSNQTERTYFAVEIFKCKVNPLIGVNECQSDKNMDLLLKNIYFTLYTLTSRVNYDNMETL
jgi:hypothetical protein